MGSLASVPQVACQYQAEMELQQAYNGLKRLAARGSLFLDRNYGEYRLTLTDRGGNKYQAMGKHLCHCITEVEKVWEEFSEKTR